jgi:DNA-binding PadR family transcriptional regulator
MHIKRRARAQRTATSGGPLNPTHHLILLLLAEEPTYGVALMERLEARSQGAIRLNAGSLYRMIAALVEDGLVEPLQEASRPEGVGAPRKLYGVTARGVAALRAEARRQQVLVEAARALDLLEETT